MHRVTMCMMTEAGRDVRQGAPPQNLFKFALVPKHLLAFSTVYGKSQSVGDFGI